MKICQDDTGHMTKIAAMLIYGENPLKNFLGTPIGPISTKLGM